MKQFVTLSANYEILRYGHDKIKNQVIDIHAANKLAKLVITKYDLIDPRLPPLNENLKFELCQLDFVDVAIYVVDRYNTVLLKRIES